VLAENTTVEQAADQLGYARPNDFDRWLSPEAKTMPSAEQPGGGA
jgi:fumarate hydratase, class II